MIENADQKLKGLLSQEVPLRVLFKRFQHEEQEVYSAFDDKGRAKLLQFGRAFLWAFLPSLPGTLAALSREGWSIADQLF